MLKRILFSLAMVLALNQVSFANAPVSPTNPADTAPSGDLGSAGFTFDLNSIVHSGIPSSAKQSWIRGGINFFFERVIGFMAGVIGTVVILMISYGGFLMLSAAGNEDQYQAGVGWIKYSLIGLAVMFSAYILVNLVQILVRSIYG